MNVILPLMVFVALVGASAPRTELVVDIVGIEHGAGNVAVALFDSAESFDAREGAIRTAFIPARQGRVRWHLAGLPPGSYAAMTYHDTNANGRLDRGAMGIPSEPYGFSNDARARFGPPRFGAAEFRLEPGRTRIRIRPR